MKKAVGSGIRIATLCVAAVFFVIALLALAAILLEFAATGGPLVIERGESSVVSPVSFTGMLPGDTTKADFTIRVAHKNTVMLRFRAEIDGEDSPLAEELKITVSVKGKSEPIYAGTIQGADNISLALLGGETDDVEYEIVSRLKEEAGNELQGASLAVNYIWWVGETDLLGSVEADKTAAGVLIGVLAAAALLAIFEFLLARRPKEVRDEP